MVPRILLPGSPEQFPNYVRALTEAGASACFWTEERPDAPLRDGLLLPGGGDVHPRRYGAPLLCCRDVDEERDELELRLIDRYAAAGRPILGICRGAQVLNVAFGGTLCQHVEGHSATALGDVLHPVRTAAGSFLADLYGSFFTVNSAHHQAVDRLGSGLRAVQWCGAVVEGISHRTAPIWGVQWHPERLEEGGRWRDTVSGQRLIRWFAAQCGGVFFRSAP